jgi:hypothetical protein
MAMIYGELLLEIPIAKEAKELVRLWWKTPRLLKSKSPSSKRRITVRTQWQSGSSNGQHWGIGFKGKPPDRQREVVYGESPPVPKP